MNGRGFWAVAALLAVMGCVAPGEAGKPTSVNPITGGEIATTSLDSPAQPAASLPKPKPRPVGAKAEPIKAEAGKAEPGKADMAKTDPAKTDQPTNIKPAPPPLPPLSPEGQACVKKGGIWGKAGLGLGNSCVMRTKDSGKSCHAGNQCEGDCLARSRTCAPYKPLFGCNAILQDNGLEVTLCID